MNSAENNKALATVLHSLFINRTDCYAVQQPDGQYYSIKQSLDINTIQQHLNGEGTIGTYQLNSRNEVKWLVFDIDPEHNNTPGETAKYLLEACLKNNRFQKAAVWLEASRHPDPSYHIWCLFQTPIPAQVAKWLGTRIFSFAEVNHKEVELFPKQTMIENGFGNCVKLPLGLHRVENKWSRFLEHETLQPLPRESILHAQGASFSEKDLEKIIQLAKAPSQIQRKLCRTIYKSATRKIRPCIIEALKADLKGDMEHHKMRLAIAVEYLAAKFSVDQTLALFKDQTDFNEVKTRYQVEHASRKEYKPFKCSKIRGLGFCIGESCPIYRRNQRDFDREVATLQ